MIERKKKRFAALLKSLGMLVLIAGYCVFAFGVGFYVGQQPKANQWLDSISASLSTLTSLYSPPIDQTLTAWTDDPARVHDGYLFLTFPFMQGDAALLIDKSGKIVHRWQVERKLFNPETAALFGVSIGEHSTFGLEDAHLYPNGDVLAIEELLDVPNYHGQRLVMIDKDSNVKWQIPGPFHHMVYVAPDQSIYTLSYDVKTSFPEIAAGNGDGKSRFLQDVLVHISPDGTLLERYNLPDMLENSSFRNFIPLSTLDLSLQRFGFKNGDGGFDILHSNSVQLIDAALAKNLPHSQPGDILISMRGPSAIGLFRPSEKRFAWMTRGPWRHQHFVRATADGKIRLFDNEGSLALQEQAKSGVKPKTYSRVVEFDPADGSARVLFSSLDYYGSHSTWFGYYADLPNHDFLVTIPENSRVLEVSPEKKIVWELRGVNERKEVNLPNVDVFWSTEYHARDYPTFLPKP